MGMLIDGKWVQASDGGADEIRNPASGEQVGQVPRASKADVDRAVVAAQAGKLRMAGMSAHRRFEVLAGVAKRIEDNQDELAKLLCRENGKRIGETAKELMAASRIFRGYAEEGKRIFGRVTPLDSVPGLEKSMAITVRRPLGVIGAIVPFNYPVELWSHKVAAGLAAGNAVITKAPDNCPLTMAVISRYMEEEGLPPAAHQFITGGREAGEALVDADGVQAILMTGSTAAGRRILQAAARTMKKVHLELGGNDATIVCEDADIDATADALIRGRFTSGNGQICCAVKRVFVHRSVFNALRDAVAARAADLKVGNPLDPSTDVGPLIHRIAAERVEEQIKQAIAQGGRTIVGGKRSGNFVEPTVLVDIPAQAPAITEEIFGPVLPLVPYDDFDDALRYANQTPYGLQAAVFTHDLRRVMRAYEILDVGTVVVNHTTAIRVESLPFGGNKDSGNGREGIHDTLLDLTKQKTLLMHEVFGGSA